MKPQVFSIGDHAKLLVISTGRFKTERFTVQFAVPTEGETAQRYAILLDLLLEGTAQYPTRAAIYRRLDDLYSADLRSFNRRAGDMQMIGYHADFLAARFVGGGTGLFPQILEMLSQVLFHPYLPHGAFHEPYLLLEKENIKEALRTRINDTGSYARTECRRLLFAGEPYALSTIGEEETLADVTGADLAAFWERMIATLAPTFCYVGALPPEVVADLVTKMLPLGGKTVYPARSIIKQHKGEVLRAKEEMPLCQSKLVLGYRTDVTPDHPLSAATVVLDEIFGGCVTSKLFVNVREKRSLCYQCSSSLDLFKGCMLASTGISQERKEEAESAICAEFDAVVRGDITPFEWDSAVRSREFERRQVMDYPGALANFYLGRHFLGMSQSVEEWRNEIRSVTREQVAEAAAHLREGAVFFLKGTLNEEEDEGE